MRRIIVGTIAAALLASPAAAKVTFAAYDGPPQIFTGEGGVHIDNHGVPVWTNGRPAKRFQVLGFITDNREDKLLSGDAMSSSSIAKKVHEVGGDALIVWDQNAKETGFTAGGSGWTNGTTSFASGGGRIVHAIATRFVVIKYLPDQPAP